ncbi:inositol-polyphosphate 5-phosphatase [Schizosaccharomyces octosporus yFS286]|uniref:phosphoinositide 5-phosphatase n=1 Tax=Schizosaccharomyces octosporus (strain yFS286) TaxID=483514 RepID=S9PUH0_SCHOY|nr:inositol-polyphosphate 5-phosphatase [Schizosaccharomyces octosporus yFS286]EPX71597.1 inositol-polyphosphate 5-phosphatase [Schizosaccharomyces octosporus yFS286]
MQCLLREQPRSLALANREYALVFHSVPQNKNSLSVCIAEFVSLSEKPLDGFRRISNRPIYGTLGLIELENSNFLCVITGASEVARIREGERIFRITEVCFYSVNRPTWDHIRQEGNSLDTGDGYDSEAPGYDASRYTSEPFGSLRKLLTNGTFYFSLDFDITSRLQLRTSHAYTDLQSDTMHEQFMWNEFMLRQLFKFRSHLNSHEKDVMDACCFYTCVIRGFSGTEPFKLGMQNVRLSLISRLSSYRAGTRFLARGVDDDGNVANYVETETILDTPNYSVSFVQVRGSIPIFWEQEGVQMFGQKIDITRSFEATRAAFEKHFSDIIKEYGPVHIVNLLGTGSGERSLSDRLRQHIQYSPEKELIHLTEFDYHSLIRSFEDANKIRPMLYGDVESFSFYSEKRNGEAMVTQDGTFRTNCLDCLDRTNVIQNLISRMILENVMIHTRQNAGYDFWQIHSTLWANNGDALSHIYTGTGALKSSFTRKGKLSLTGALNDLSKSVGRMYINNFQDKGRQETIDLLLGRLIDQHPVILYDPIHEYVNHELKKRENEFSEQKNISIFVASYNLNGCLPTSDLEKWLFPDDNPMADIYVVGFQEIVQLTPQQVINADPAKRREWETCVKQLLNSKAKYGTNYVQLRSGQLVGTAMIVFVKESCLPSIKNVEGTLKKTGLGGVSGNKGAVAIRFDFEDTGICFITSHLAAGHTNYDERNHDYQTIANGLRFKRGRSIFNHDYVVWFGDFNYRISLTYEDTLYCIEQGKLQNLFENDQLNNQMLTGEVFPFFSELPITFLPTYKFDIGTDIYDTSDKHRVPAWTDRILYRGELKQTAYNSAPLYFSDHRPVYASYDASIVKIDKAKKKKLFEEIYMQRKVEVRDANSTSYTLIDISGSVAEKPNLIPYVPANGMDKLKKPSLDNRKWWFEDGLPARSIAARPGNDYQLNPDRPVNPFTPSKEPDWIKPEKCLTLENRQEQDPAVNSQSNPLHSLDASHPALIPQQSPSKPTKPSKPERLAAPRMKPALPPRSNPSSSNSTSLRSSPSNIPPTPPPRKSTNTTPQPDLLGSSPEDSKLTWKPLV